MLFIFLVGLVVVIILFALIRKRNSLKKTDLFAKGWYNKSHIKPPSSCCSVRQRKVDDRISIM